jgi:hypothetical protein
MKEQKNVILLSFLSNMIRGKIRGSSVKSDEGFSI